MRKMGKLYRICSFVLVVYALVAAQVYGYRAVASQDRGWTPSRFGGRDSRNVATLVSIDNVVSSFRLGAKEDTGLSGKDSNASVVVPETGGFGESFMAQKNHILLEKLETPPDG